MSTGTHTPEVADSPGVYQIRCKRNGKFYVGSAVNLRTRWDTHRRDLRRGSHHNPYLQLAWKLYGEINFEPVVRITNLSACGLSRVHMFQLKSGKRPSHKAWTWKHDADRAFE
jgi:GIY-YIG catalytic domain